MCLVLKSTGPYRGMPAGTGKMHDHMFPTSSADSLGKGALEILCEHLKK